MNSSQMFQIRLFPLIYRLADRALHDFYLGLPIAIGRWIDLFIGFDAR